MRKAIIGGLTSNGAVAESHTMCEQALQHGGRADY
jgi:hypothetical protein